MPTSRSANDRPQFYKPSGELTAAGFVLALAISLTGGLFAAYCYAFADFYCPLIYANIVLIAAMGFAVGFATAIGSHIGRLRNPRLTANMALLVAIVSFAATWIIWLWLVGRGGENDPSFAAMLRHPTVFWHVLGWVYEHGTWSFSPHAEFSMQQIGYQVRGVLLVLVWVGEAIAFFGTAIYVASRQTSLRAFCEPCNRWCSKPAFLHSYRGALSAAELKIRLQAGDWDYLGLLPAPLYGELSRLQLFVESCPACSKSHFLTLSRATSPPNRKLLEGSKRMPVMEKLIISSKDLEAIASSHPYEPGESAESRVERLKANFMDPTDGETDGEIEGQ